MIEKLINFNGRFHHKVNENGEFFRFRYWICSLEEKDIIEIRELHKSSQMSYLQLVKKFNISLRTIARIITSKQEDWILCKTKPNKQKQLRITLCDNKIQKTFLAHRLVLETFVGPCPEGMECCHNNGNPSDIRLSNLRWDTPKNNAKDKIKHGTYFPVNKKPSVFLSSLEKQKLLRKRQNGCSIQELSKEYGIHSRTVIRICKKLQQI